MKTAGETIAESAGKEAPAVPLTIEGASVLHQMFRLRRSAWRALDKSAQQEVAAEAAAFFAEMEEAPGGQSAIYSLLGHKAELLFLHFRRSFEELKAAELKLASLRLYEYLEAATSYLSVVELG
ncbi:MAG TPA: chlorite dismutase family protein, partial [Terriglobales bacterium]